MAHLAHYKEAHPTVFRMTHWINLVAMVLLILSGIYIHFPVFDGFMGIARGIHIFFGFVFLINLIVRIVLAFVVKTAPAGGTREVETDWRSWFPQKHNRHQLGAWIKYYLFFKKDHPLGGKYGVPQKLAYLALIPCMLFMAYTGFCLWGATMYIPFFAGFTTLVGGLMKVRVIHYFMMFFFICFMMLHGYLAMIEGTAPAKMMFFGKEHGGLTYDLETKNISGADLMAPIDEIVEEVVEEAEATA